MMRRVFQGPNRNGLRFPDLAGREATALAVLAAAIFWLGLYPKPFLDMSGPALKSLTASAPAEQPRAAAQTEENR